MQVSYHHPKHPCIFRVVYCTCMRALKIYAQLQQLFYGHAKYLSQNTQGLLSLVLMCMQKSHVLIHHLPTSGELQEHYLAWHCFRAFTCIFCEHGCQNPCHHAVPFSQGCHSLCALASMQSDKLDIHVWLQHAN